MVGGLTVKVKQTGTHVWLYVLANISMYVRCYNTPSLYIRVNGLSD